MICYCIPNWNERFESAASRPLKSLSSVLMPCNHDGDAYAELMEREDGAALYGAWAVIVQTAAKCHPRGTLVKSNGVAHTAQSIARITRCKLEVIEKAVAVLLENGWLLEVITEPMSKIGKPTDSISTPISNPQQGSKEVKKEKKETTALSENIPTETKPLTDDPKKRSVDWPCLERTPFEIAWKLWPANARSAPGDASRMFKEALKKVSQDTLMAKIKEYSESPQGKGQYCPGMAVWLRKERWNDAPENWGNSYDGKIITPRPKPPPPNPMENLPEGDFGSSFEDINQELRDADPQQCQSEPFSDEDPTGAAVPRPSD